MMERLDLGRSDALIALVATLSVFVYVTAAGVGGAGFPLDDGWIHQTYARNLAQRGEWAFVPGTPSAGSTAPLWTALLAVGYALSVHYALWTHALGALCLALTGIFGARVAEHTFPELREYHVGLLTGLAAVLEWHLVWAAASGMETALFGALSMAVILAALYEAPALLLGFLGGLLTLTRPEGVGLVGLVGLILIATQQGRRVAGTATGWLAGVAPGALLNLSLSGSPLPNTASAKQAEYAALLAQPYLARLLDVTAPIMAGVLFLLVPGIVWGLVERSKRFTLDELASRSLPLLWGVALLMLYALRLPVSYQHGRYVIPVIPHFIVWGIGGTLALLRAGRRKMWSRLLSRTLAGTAVLTLLIFWGMGLNIYTTDVRIIQSEMVAAAQYLAEEIPPEARLAVHDIGAVGYFAPRTILDLAGLVSPEVIPIIRDEQALLKLMETRKAEYLMTFPGWYPDIVKDPRVQLIYQTEGTGPKSGGENMAIYRLDWER